MRVGKTAEPCLSFWYNSCISAPGIYGSFLISIKRFGLEICGSRDKMFVEKLLVFYLNSAF